MPLEKGIGNTIFPVSARCSMVLFLRCYQLRKIQSAYYGDMTSLPDEHPEVHEFMRNGKFSAQMSNDNTFERIPVDQTL